MPKIIALVGIPGSGKTTYRTGAGIPYTCRDEIREKLFGKDYKFSRERERQVTLYRDDEIDTTINLLRSDIIVDETFCNKKSRDSLLALAKELGVEVVWKVMEDSFDVDLCHKRNAARERTVPYEVIERMFKGFIEFTQESEDYGWVPNRVNRNGAKSAIIVDVDGTLADHTGIRSPFDWDKVDLDRPKQHVIDMVNGYCRQKHCDMIILSGRDGSCRDKTLQWLDSHGVEYDELFMRETGDSRKDFKIKMELYTKHIQDQYDVQMVVDDRRSVCRYWSALGLNLLQVDCHGFF